MPPSKVSGESMYCSAQSPNDRRLRALNLDHYGNFRAIFYGAGGDYMVAAGLELVTRVPELMLECRRPVNRAFTLLRSSLMDDEGYMLMEQVLEYPRHYMNGDTIHYTYELKVVKT